MIYDMLLQRCYFNRQVEMTPAYAALDSFEEVVGRVGGREGGRVDRWKGG